MLNRKNFKKRVVDEVYELQDGVCAKCSRSLVGGYERHHKDGNPLNNTKDNLELLCSQCHKATYQGDGRANLKSYTKQQKIAIENLNKMVAKALNEGLSGNSIGAALEAIKQALLISQDVYGIEEPEQIDVLMNPWDDTEKEVVSYKKGYETGFRDGWIQRGSTKHDLQEDDLV